MTDPLQPGAPEPERFGEEADRPRVGVDEWVASFGRRRQEATGVQGWLLRGWDSLPPFARLAVAVIPAAFLPLIMNEGNLFRFGLYTLLYAMMGLGLNVAVGFAGLLDLGYIAFVGFGAYGYGVLASPQFGHHWQAEAAVPVITIATAVLGVLVGLPSRRLVGDYLAIVTLFFGQAFVVFVNNANRINFCGIPHWIFHKPPDWKCNVDLTGGANGLQNIDPLNLFGYELSSTTQKYYLLLIAISVVLAALYFANQSRTGRALRALREDPLAAEAMGMPVNRLKLLAFAFGAAIAGFTGTIYGSVQTGAFPGDYDVGLLITIYAVVILGGSGSLAGAVLGAVVINCVPEIMRTQQDAGWLFYGVILLALLLKLRPWRTCALVLGGLVAFGLVVHSIGDAISSSATAGHAVSTGPLKGVTEAWVLLPSNPTRAADFCYVILIGAILLVTRLHGVRR